MADHPVRVPPECFAQWLSEAMLEHDTKPGTVASLVADKAAQWGADQELEACCEWLGGSGYAGTSSTLRAARRPKPPTLAEQGMEALRSTPCTEQRHYDAMFAALNRLAELEAKQ